jgi:hypothetical protein
MFGERLTLQVLYGFPFVQQVRLEAFVVRSTIVQCILGPPFQQLTDSTTPTIPPT